jgi:hypothetical protein
MIATRPDWCISRQRIWGVPIAVFLCEKCHEPLNDEAINKSVVELFAKEGADAWYIRRRRRCCLRDGLQGCGSGHAVSQGDGHPRRVVRERRELACGARRRAGAALALPISIPRAAISIADGFTLPC